MLNPRGELEICNFASLMKSAGSNPVLKARARKHLSPRLGDSELLTYTDRVMPISVRKMESLELPGLSIRSEREQKRPEEKINFLLILVQKLSEDETQFSSDRPTSLMGARLTWKCTLRRSIFHFPDLDNDFLCKMHWNQKLQDQPLRRIMQARFPP